MKEKLDGHAKIDIVKEGLKKFCAESWPSFYPQWPLKIGIAAFNLKGIIGKTSIQELVPLMVSPTRAELTNLADLNTTGGSPVRDGLAYARNLIHSIGTIDRLRRPAVRRIKLISDGGNKGPDPVPVSEQIAKDGIKLDSVELASRPSAFMAKLAEKGQGIHYCVRTVDELMMALELPRFSEYY
jgi:hypothetical protein